MCCIAGPCVSGLCFSRWVFCYLNKGEVGVSTRREQVFSVNWDEAVIALLSPQCHLNLGEGHGDYRDATRAISATFCLLDQWKMVHISPHPNKSTSGLAKVGWGCCEWVKLAAVMWSLSCCQGSVALAFSTCDTIVLSCPGAALQAVNVTIEHQPAEQIIASFWGEEIRTC